jgi:hypothetical protein
LKPSNILIDSLGHALIGDFGTSRLEVDDATSNAAESVHAKLNDLKNPNQLLVMQSCLDRYAQRNLKSRKQARASTRFYRLLHNDDVKLPNGWEDPKPAKSVPNPADDPEEVHAVDPVAMLLNDFGDDDKSLLPGGFDTGNKFLDLAWDIMFSIRSIVPERWNQDVRKIIAETLKIGNNLVRDSHADLNTPKHEAQWRCEAYRAAGIKRMQVSSKRLTCPPEFQPWAPASKPSGN